MATGKRKSCSKSNAAPSAPCLELLEHHYGSESGCDVVFLVGPSHDNCLRIPAHSLVLKEATPVFGAMFSSNFFTQQKRQSLLIEDGGNGTEERIPIPKQIPVPDLDGKAFDNLMKYLYDVPFALQSAETTIETLKAAHKYQCAGLVRNCVSHLISLISVDSVLLVTANVAVLCGDFQNLENLCRECTGKPGDCVAFPHIFQRRLSEANSELNIELDCARLVYNCLDFIDRNARAVLQSEEIEDLDYATIHHILSRDTLNVEEGLVFGAIIRWADKECKRRHLPLTIESKREVLRDLIFVPRYLQMNSTSFISGPVQSGVLSSEEIKTITHVIQLGPETFMSSSQQQSSSNNSSSPECSPFKRIQNLGLPASKSLRIHLAYMLRPRRAPDENRNQGSNGAQVASQDGNWIARLKKMRCCLLCFENKGGDGNGSRCTSPAILSSPGSPVRSVGGSEYNYEHRASISSAGGPARREQYKAGFVERAVVIWACLFD